MDDKDRNGKDEATGGTTDGGLSRRDALFGIATAAGFVTLGLKQAVADSRVSGKPVLNAGDCGQLNKLVPSAPGPEYNRLLDEGIADPQGFVMKRFTLTKQQQAAFDAATPADVAAVKQSLQRARVENLRIHFDCGHVATPGDKVLHESQKMRIATLTSQSSRAPSQGIQQGGPKAFGGTLKIQTAPI